MCTENGAAKLKTKKKKHRESGLSHVQKSGPFADDACHHLDINPAFPPLSRVSSRNQHRGRPLLEDEVCLAQPDSGTTSMLQSFDSCLATSSRNEIIARSRRAAPFVGGQPVATALAHAHAWHGQTTLFRSSMRDRAPSWCPRCTSIYHHRLCRKVNCWP